MTLSKVLLFVHLTNAKVPRSEPKDEGSGFRITPKHRGVEYHLICWREGRRLRRLSHGDARRSRRERQGGPDPAFQLQGRGLFSQFGSSFCIVGYFPPNTPPEHAYHKFEFRFLNQKFSGASRPSAYVRL
jgi:hypothetical protein